MRFDFIMALRHLQDMPPHALKTDCPPCGGISIEAWDQMLAGTFNLLCLASCDEERFRILGQAERRFTCWALEAATADFDSEVPAEVARCKQLISEWFDALIADSSSEVKA